MDLNRNQFFFLGLVVLLIGVQVRYVSAYVLNPKATQFLAERTGQASSASALVFLRDDRHRSRRRAKCWSRPNGSRWCLISVGAVLCCTRLAMPKPG